MRTSLSCTSLCIALLFQISPLAAPLRFLVIGDWGWNGHYGQKGVAEQLGKTAGEIGAEFIISTGDNFQVNGVRSADDPLWLSSFENVYTHPSLLVDWFCVLGNHDYIGSPQAEIDYSKKSRRWNMPARYYAIQRETSDATAVDIYFLDTSPFFQAVYPNVSGQDTAHQLRWLDSSLAASKSRWKIVAGHHPVFSSGTHASDLSDMPGRFEPLFKKYGVDVYFSGHDHQLECLRGDSSRTRYFISGGGSERIRSVKPTARTLFLACAPGFMSVAVKPDTMRVQLISSAGVPLHTELLTK